MTDPPIVLSNPEELLLQGTPGDHLNHHAVPVCDQLPKDPKVGDTCFVSSCGRIFHFASDDRWRYIIFEEPGALPSFILPTTCKDSCLIKRLARS